MQNLAGLKDLPGLYREVSIVNKPIHDCRLTIHLSPDYAFKIRKKISSFQKLPLTLNYKALLWTHRLSTWTH